MNTLAPFELHGPAAIKDVAPVTREHVNALKHRVQQSWLHGKEQRLSTGELLLQLRQALSKKGYGTFNDALSELGIPRSTAHDYIQAYRVAEGHKPAAPKKARKSGNRTFQDLHRLKDAVGEYLRQRPEDIEDFRAWVSSNYPKKIADPTI